MRLGGNASKVDGLRETRKVSWGPRWKLVE